MAKWDHLNAHDVYPPELVKEIQKYYSGGYLWIPEPKSKKFKRTVDRMDESYEHARKS